MRILFDQGTPVPIAAYLRENSVRTTLQEGWDTFTNGDLLRVAEEAGFEVRVTTDNNLAIVVISRNRWRLVQRVIRKIVAAVNGAAPGSYTLIDVPGK